MFARHDSLATLPNSPASAIKKQGWKGVMRSLSEGGRLVVTNHREPEAVILSISEYVELVRAASAAGEGATDPLQVLRERFDARLAELEQPDAGDRLRALMRRPGALGGAVKAGDTY